MVKDEKETLAYKLGRFVGAGLVMTTVGCIIALLIALTYKLILWIL